MIVTTLMFHPQKKSPQAAASGCAARPVPRTRGFTLIELMIVVVIMAIISAVLVPLIVGGLDKDKPEEHLAPAVKSRPPKTEAGPPGVIPVTESADIKVNLETRHYLHRLKVYTIFEAFFEGDFVLKNNSESESLIKLFFPFPSGTTQARNVSLKFLNTDKNFVEPDGVKYTLTGISWIGPLPRGHNLKARVTYGAQGRDKFEYVGPGAGRAGTFKLALSIKGLTSESIPADALQPSRVRPGSFLWDYENLITDRKVIVELPGALSPIGRTILLSKLAALSVLLFGIGFLYLSDLRQPGRLDDFRWGHFLLLALNYFMFFIIFIVLNLSGRLGPWLSISLAAVLSLPLLMLHVSRVLDKFFALKSVLPLAVFTLAIVITGVFGGEVKKYLFVAYAVLTVGFLTVTYRTWSEKRKAHREEKERRFEEQYRQEKEQERKKEEKKKLAAEMQAMKEESIKAVRKAGSAWNEMDTSILDAQLLLETEDFEDHLLSRNNLENTLAQLSGFGDEFKGLDNKLADVSSKADPEEQAASYAEINRDCKVFQQRLELYTQKLKNSIKDLVRRREIAPIKADRSKEVMHCIACGTARPPSKYCPHCGILTPLELECGKCGQIFRLPVHIIAPRQAHDPVHCMVCGEPFHFDPDLLSADKGPPSTPDTTFLERLP